MGSSASSIPKPAAESKISSETKPATPKPCCVCKDEKAARDECMLFSKSGDPQQECASLVDKYRACMGTYGFKV